MIRPLPLTKLILNLDIDSSVPSGLRWSTGQGRGISAGAPAGSPDGNGYHRVTVGGQQYLTHRVVWAITNSQDPGSLLVDHIDRNSFNNHPNNLRLVTPRGNSQNRSNASKFGPGVKYNGRSKSNPYEARAWIEGNRRHLGCFPTPEAAQLAYQLATN